jgi:hypothetical protein
MRGLLVYNVGVPESIAALIKSLIACQQEFAPLKKSAKNPHFKNTFVPLSEVVENVLPVLNKHGLAVTQLPSTLEDGTPALMTVLMHESGEQLSATMPLMMVKPDPQGQGSAITYARRYALMSVLGLVGDEDDDGTAAVKPAPAREVTQLDRAKAELRKLVVTLPKAEQAQYSWVKTSTDIEEIRDQAKALNALRAGNPIA